MPIIDRLKSQIETQSHLFAQALPKLQAAEALESHLRAVGINANTIGTLDATNCSALVYITGESRSTLNAIEHAGLFAEFLDARESPQGNLSIYQVTALGQTVSVIIQSASERPSLSVVSA